MQTALLYINGSWDPYVAEYITADYKKYPCKCIGCDQSATLCICGGSRKNYFMSNHHTPGCDYAFGGKINKAPKRRIPKIIEMMEHEDKPIVFKDPKDEEPTQEPDKAKDTDDEDEPIDNMTDDSDVELHVCSTIYNALREMGPNEMLDIGLPRKEYLINLESIQDARTEILTGPKMFVTTKTSVPFEKSSTFFCLRDAYTAEPEHSIYVLIRFDEPTVYEEFIAKIIGNKEKGIKMDPRQYIVVAGEIVRKVPNDTYTIYELSPLSKARYCFTNKR